MAPNSRYLDTSIFFHVIFTNEADIGINGLIILIKSLNVDARQLAVRQIAEISVVAEKIKDIVEANGIKALLTTLVPSTTTALGTPTQIEALLAIANISYDVSAQKVSRCKIIRLLTLIYLAIAR